MKTRTGIGTEKRRLIYDLSYWELYWSLRINFIIYLFICVFLLFIFGGKLKTPDKQKPAGGEENCHRENQTSAKLSDLRCFNLVIRSLNIYLRANSRSTSQWNPSLHVTICYCCCWQECELVLQDWDDWLKSSVFDSKRFANCHRPSKHCKNPSDKKLQRLQSHFQFEENTWMYVNLSEYASRLTGWLQRVDIPALFWTWRKETCRRPETAARWCRPPSRNYPTISQPIAEKQLTSA